MRRLTYRVFHCGDPSTSQGYATKLHRNTSVDCDRSSIAEIANERYYGALSGGALEATGRLFKRSVKMYVYPQLDPATGRVMTIETLPVKGGWEHLRNYLLEAGRLQPVRRYDERLLSILTKDVLARIQSGDAAWETMVPPVVASTIKAQRLFGVRSTAAPA